ncbi:hypothetical protein LTS18_005747 [Coniosporium uncinatum]|uniref:Uncharacterized protein n=1 Tax=Coniosporium uncinatum TaxID=93489 RepID=A0ACC3D4M8_9PEZI|nr:hypothetical protein LTS18_005747 [Coniosporium uncinatum]
MTPTSAALTTKVDSGTPYQLDSAQVNRAASSLLKHIRTTTSESTARSTKKNLLADTDGTSEDSSAEATSEIPIWLILTTKKFLTDTKRLKPGKIPLPHPLNTSTSLRICLITADPQRTYKDLIASPAFPAGLRAKIARVIGITKLKAKYKSYESLRQLFGEYDVFLADERIITYLPQTLGKVFYKGGAKRPVPVSLTGNERPAEKAAKDSLGQKVRQTRPDGKKGSVVVGKAEAVAAELERALGAALVHVSPSTTTAVKVAMAGWEAGWVAENVEKVVEGLVEKFVPQKWRGVRAIHVKGPNTMALPVWLASELWEDEGDVLDERWEASERQEGKKGKKRGREGDVKGAKREEQKVVKEKGEGERPKKKRRSDAAKVVSV